MEPDKWQVFDHIHSPRTSNEDVYKKSGFDCVENALKGYNTAVFAYGQQGSGKTRTLMSKDGITAYTVSHLFNRIAKNNSQNFAVSCSYIQIYNEHIYDLLNPDNEFECTVREHKTRGLYVENVTRVPCQTPKDVYELINIGRRSLVLAETKLNHRSSRSHAVCQLQIEYADKTIRKKSNSILNAAFAPLNYAAIAEENDEAYIDFDTVPFQRKNIKRSHSIAITKMNERNRFHQSGISSDSEKSEKSSGRCSHISHHKNDPRNKFIKKSHSFRGDRLPSYSRRFQERRYFNMSSMCDVKLYQGKESDRSEQNEKTAVDDIGLPPTGIPAPMRYPSIFHAAIEQQPPAADVNSRSCDRKRPIRVSMQIPRLIRKSRDDSGVDSNTSQSEEDISDMMSSDFYFPNKFQTSEHHGSEYLDLANHDETRLYDAERQLMQKNNKNSINHQQQNTVCSKISIVDLAGSERVKKSHVSGERLKEAQHINLSLLELGNVISALADGKKKHVPYRNSILTRLLQDTLGGNSRLTFLLCVSTRMADVSETKCTLEFGQKLKKILTTPSINVDYYKWKYENACADYTHKKERRERQEARRSKLEQEYNDNNNNDGDDDNDETTDQIEYNNVIGEYDQSKTLIDMLQYMMGLNGIRTGAAAAVANEPEADSLFTDVDDAGTETDDTLTEASDLDADYNEDLDSGFDSTSNLLASQNMAFSDLSLNSSMLQDSEMEELLPLEENSVDFDLFEIPEPVAVDSYDEDLHEDEPANAGMQQSSFAIVDKEEDEKNSEEGEEEDEDDNEERDQEDHEETTEDEGFITQSVSTDQTTGHSGINSSHSLEKFLADETACFNDIDDEPPLMTSSPNCTNEEASFASDSETDSLSCSLSDADSAEIENADEANKDILEETADFKYDQHELYTTVSSEQIDIAEINEMTHEIMTSQMLRIETESVTSEVSDVISESLTPNGEAERRLRNARKLEVLRARLRGVRDTHHMHHVRNGCWCQRKQHV